MEPMKDEDFKKTMDEYIEKSEVIPLQVDEHYGVGARYLVEQGFWNTHFETVETPQGLKHHGVFVKKEFAISRYEPMIQKAIDMTLDEVFKRFNEISAKEDRRLDRQSKRKNRKRELSKRN